MPTNTDPSLGQPRKNGAYSNRVMTAPNLDEPLRFNAVGDLGVHATDVVPGDIVYDVETDTVLGTASTVGIHPLNPDKICVRLHTGGYITADPDDIIAVHRSANAPQFSADDSYQDRLAAIYHRETTAEVLDEVLDQEVEDDFMLAIVRHPNATTDQIERASEHHLFIVRETAIEHPNTADATLTRIRDHALAEVERYEAENSTAGRNVGTTHRIWEITNNRRVAASASVKLLTRHT